MKSSLNNPSRSPMPRPRVAMITAALPLVALLVAPPALVEATTVSGAELVQPAIAISVASNPERASELEARAWEMRDQINRRKAAARLYREAADLRDDSDPMKVQSLRNASRMNYYAGRTHRALNDAAEAARLALRQGDVLAAAHVHVDAAWLAVEIGDNATAERHLVDARMLAASPLLAQAQRADLMNRMAQPA